MRDQAAAAPAALPARVGWATRCLDGLDAALGLGLVVLLAGIVLDVAAGVVSRYVFNASFRWTEEVGYLLFLWLIFTGITVAHRRRLHISVAVLSLILPASTRPVLDFLANAIVAYTTFVLVASGWDAMVLIGGELPALGWPNEIRFVILPLSAALGLVYLVLREIEEHGSPWAMLGAIAAAAAVYGLTAVSGTLRMPAVSPTLIMGVAFGTALLVGAPIAYVLLFSAYVATWGADLLPPAAVAQNVVNGASKFILLAIPLFLLAGYLMNLGGLTPRLIGLAQVLVGHWRGGFAQVNVLSSVFVGGVSGSSSADAAMDSKLLVPQMVRHGYAPEFSCAITAASAVLPNIIPPSIAMLIYASVAQTSIIKLFLSGYLVGLMLAAVLMVFVYVESRRRGYGFDAGRASLAERLAALRRAAPVLVMPALIVGGIRFGVTTATEAGAIAVLYALALGVAYREYGVTAGYRSVRDAAIDTALVGFLLAVTAPFGYVMIAERIPQQIVGAAAAFTQEPLVLLLILNLLMLVAGMFLDLAASVLIVVPLALPVVTAAGIDPIHFAMIVIVNLMIGGITPPVGQLVFVTASIARVSPNAVFRAALPFFVALLIGLALLTVFPGISLLLPRLLG